MKIQFKKATIGERACHQNECMSDDTGYTFVRSRTRLAM